MAEPLIFHIDVNSAFLSWEAARRLKDNPNSKDLRLLHAVIGGDEEQRHGIVLAKSPSAKKYGVQTCEPLSHARRKCPSATICLRIVGSMLLSGIPAVFSITWFAKLMP